MGDRIGIHATTPQLVWELRGKKGFACTVGTFIALGTRSAIKHKSCTTSSNKLLIPFINNRLNPLAQNETLGILCKNAIWQKFSLLPVFPDAGHKFAPCDKHPKLETEGAITRGGKCFLRKSLVGSPLRWRFPRT